jgi:hypothetical protein
MDNSRLMRMAVDCGMAVSVIGLAFYLRYALSFGLDIAFWIKGNLAP